MNMFDVSLPRYFAYSMLEVSGLSDGGWTVHLAYSAVIGGVDAQVPVVPLEDVRVSVLQSVQPITLASLTRFNLGGTQRPLCQPMQAGQLITLIDGPLLPFEIPINVYSNS